MRDIVITGASKGIGRALALALAAPTCRLVLTARDEAALQELARDVRSRGGEAHVLVADLDTRAGARSASAVIAAHIGPGAVLVQNAGIWPAARVLSDDGLERAFVVNHLAPALLQEPLLREGRIARVLVNSAGLAVKGRFDPERTPRGDDFSAIRTYATTKLCFALWMREVAARFPAVDVAVVHPGVVRTDLGARPGLLGFALALAKRRWESPEVCGARLARIMARDRWSSPGEARWMMEEKASPWPAALDDTAVRERVRQVTERLLAET